MFESSPRLLAWLAGMTILIGFSFPLLHNYLLFHALAEMFSIIVSMAIFMIFWNTRRFTDNGYFTIIGIAFLQIGLIDFLHTLAFKGMGVFFGHDANLPTQLWIGARFMQAGALLAAPALVDRKLPATRVLAVFAGATAVLLLAIFADLFPDCYVEGRGLTPFKIGSEYAICMLLTGSALLHLRRRDSLPADGLRFLLAAIFLAILSELAFTSYLGVYDGANAIGHLLKIASFYFMYRALVETTLLAPYELVFRDIRQAQENMRVIFNNVHEAIFIHGIDGTIIDINDKMLELYGVSREEALTLSIKDDYSDPDNPLDLLDSIWADVISGSTRVFEWNARQPHDGTVFPVEVSLRRIALQGRDVVLATVRDITERKLVERELEQLTRTDGLTGIANRRCFDEMLLKEWRLGLRDRSSMALLIVDIDHFKLYNDRYGHLQGDECLKAVARAIRSAMRRPGDVVARYGGEEFAVILPRTSAKGVCTAAERVIGAVQNLAMEHSDSPAGMVTVSVGVACLIPVSPQEPIALVAMADKALYEAKASGRNKAVCQLGEPAAAAAA